VIEPMPMATAVSRDTRLPSSPVTAGARKATSASSGTMARSSSSRMETIFCPGGALSSPRSSSICMTMAVEVSTKPAPATKATAGGSRAAIPTAVSSAGADADLQHAEPEDLLAQAPQPGRLASPAR
jgi:hypothetical protein